MGKLITGIDVLGRSTDRVGLSILDSTYDISVTAKVGHEHEHS